MVIVTKYEEKRKKRQVRVVTSETLGERGQVGERGIYSLQVE